MASIQSAMTHQPPVGGVERVYFWLVLVACLGLGSGWAAGGERGDPNGQAELIAKLTAENQADKAEAILWAQAYGYPVRYEDDQRVYELMGVWRDRPVYYVTDNVDAAISSAADRIRNLAPWQLDGSGVILGLWDESVARASHQEFMGADGKPRVQAGDKGAVSSHTTHVAGTLAAGGVDPAAEGMAPAARVQSFNWNYDSAKMASWAAYAPGQPNTIYISNHSYGYVGGWEYVGSSGLTGHKGWHWTGLWAGNKSYDDWFGVYHAIARQWDDVAYVNGYYLAFAAAGNDRTDNPSVGETVYYSKSNIWYSIVYDPATCPPGDGVAKGGYDTICGPGVAKNIMTVGAVGDAVTNGARSLADANMASFSSWGPANDGRIKPDIVANGIRLYSADSNADDSYATYSGTSMASPNAAGSAALLVDLYQQLFPGKSMRSSTLKGLIIHTADDLGRPGPDYQFGWGLMNARAAAELIQRQYDEPAASTLAEGRLTANTFTSFNPDDDYYVWSDANEPLRVTLCWTDPPAVYITDFENPAPRLINDLDLRVIGPDRTTTYYPYVLIRVDPCVIATTGDNKVDNVEQVYIGTPAEVGLYKVHISYKGTLSKDQQYYSVVSSMPLYAQSPPVAEDTPAYTAVDTATTISLKATDDGLPTTPGRLAYTITSLPLHGLLTYPTGTPITAPGKLANYGNQIVYKPIASYTGEDSFCFYAEDGGTVPSGGASNVATVAISIASLMTREYQVLAREDDASVLSWSKVQVTADSYLRVGQYVCGMRFQNIDVPPGAQIAGACLKVHCRTAAGVKGLIQAEATGNAGDLAGEDRNLLDMLKTQAAVSWNWTGKESTETWQSSPDCSTVLQEIVDRPGWKAGNAIVLILSGTRIASGDLILSARDSGVSVAPRLEITYTVKSATTVDPGRKAPTAMSVELYVSANTPAPLILEANDDGLPASLQFTISSLPSHGSLALVNGATIKEPMSLAGSTCRVIYTPSASFTGNDSFTFCADDGGTAPTGGKSSAAVVTLKVRHMVTRQYQVIAREDDADGTDSGTTVLSETLRVGRHSSAMRFRNIDVPRESEIISARLKLCMDVERIDKPVGGVVYAQAVGDANDFNQPDLRIPMLPRTQASVSWNWAAGQTCVRDAYCSSPELRTVIQETVDRDDWCAGNCAAILYAGAASSSQDLSFFACSSPYSNRAAKLEITHTLAPGVKWAEEGSVPQAGDAKVSTTAEKPLAITLRAIDDGLPNPPGKLTFTIVSPPSHGTLEYPAGGQITPSGTLPDFGNQVVYRPEPSFTGEDRFTFYADDGGMAPAGGKSNTGTITVTITAPIIQTVTRVLAVKSIQDDASAAPRSPWNSVYDKCLRIGVSTSAMRFTQVDIPQGSHILSARLRVVMWPNPVQVVNRIDGLIQAEAADNPADFSGAERYVCQLPRTTASVPWIWDIGVHEGHDPSSIWQSSPDISAIVEEIVNRPGWSPGNAIAIIYSSTNQPTQDIEFVAYAFCYPYDGYCNPAEFPGPQLLVTYAK